MNFSDSRVWIRDTSDRGADYESPLLVYTPTVCVKTSSSTVPVGLVSGSGSGVRVRVARRQAAVSAVSHAHHHSPNHSAPTETAPSGPPSGSSHRTLAGVDLYPVRLPCSTSTRTSCRTRRRSPQRRDEPFYELQLLKPYVFFDVARGTMARAAAAAREAARRWATRCAPKLLEVELS